MYHFFLTCYIAMLYTIRECYITKVWYNTPGVLYNSDPRFQMTVICKPDHCNIDDNIEQYWQYCTICTIYWNSSNIDNITIVYFILPAILCTILSQYCILYCCKYCCQYKVSIVQYCCQYWQHEYIKLFQIVNIDLNIVHILSVL